MLLNSEFWVKAFLKNHSLKGRPGYVIRRGHESAGEIIIKVNSCNGNCRLFRRYFELDKETYHWSCVLEDKEQKIDEYIKKQISFDPDLWVIEIENPNQESFALD